MVIQAGCEKKSYLKLDLAIRPSFTMRYFKTTREHSLQPFPTCWRSVGSATMICTVDFFGFSSPLQPTLLSDVCVVFTWTPVCSSLQDWEASLSFTPGSWLSAGLHCARVKRLWHRKLHISWNILKWALTVPWWRPTPQKLQWQSTFWSMSKAFSILSNLKRPTKDDTEGLFHFTDLQGLFSVFLLDLFLIKNQSSDLSPRLRSRDMKSSSIKDWILQANLSHWSLNSPFIKTTISYLNCLMLTMIKWWQQKQQHKGKVCYSEPASESAAGKCSKESLHKPASSLQLSPTNHCGPYWQVSLSSPAQTPQPMEDSLAACKWMNF